MVAWEEFYYLLCAHTPENLTRSPDREVPRAASPTAPVSSHRRPSLAREGRQAARAPLRIAAHGDVSIAFPMRQVRVALFVAMVGITYVPSAYIYDLNTGRRDTLTALVLSWATFLISFAATSAIAAAAPGMPDSGIPVTLLGLLVGMALGVGVRMFDGLIYKWWMKGMGEVFFPMY